MKEKKKERRKKINEDNFLKTNRDQMINNVCSIIFKHIEAAEKFISVPTEGAMLFNEVNFLR